MKHLKISLLLLLSVLFPLTALAQSTEISPYSRFGYGALSSGENAVQRAMGGVGLAMRSGRTINFMNPASYAAIDSVTFLFDISASVKTLKTSEIRDKEELTGKKFTGGLDYVAIQFPLTRYGGMAVGLTPYSQVGYSFGNEIMNGTNAHQGSGGISELFIGLSAKPFKGLTVGANISYMFGTLLHDTYVYGVNEQTGQTSTSLFERVTQVRDYNLKFGVQYGVAVGRDNYFTLGAIYSPKKSFHGHAYGVKYDVGSDTKNDTIGYASMKGLYEKAPLYGVGLSWQWRGQLLVEADFTYEPWKDAKYRLIEGFDQTTGSRFDDRWKMALGAQYVPAIRGGYLRRINYRLGGYYSNDYIMVGSNNVREYGLSLGFGLPAPSSKTMINLSFDYRHREATPQTLVKENYFQVTLGVNINELWFWQNKIR